MNQGHPSWYGLLVRPQFENLVAANLSRKDLHIFLPTFTNLSRSKRHKRIELLFPGCVFCRVHRAGVASLLTLPGVMHIIGMGTGQNPIDEREINAIRLATQAGLPCQPSVFPVTGPKVRICKGPLRDLEGFLVQKGSGIRIVMGISVLRRGVVVELGKSVETVSLPHERTIAMSARAKVC